jgi:hypothetical protein
MYRYVACQGDLRVAVTLSPDFPEHLLVAVAALFHKYPKDAAFDKPIEVYQDALPVMEDQVKETVERLKSIFLKMEVMK